MSTGVLGALLEKAQFAFLGFVINYFHSTTRLERHFDYDFGLSPRVSRVARE